MFKSKFFVVLVLIVYALFVFFEFSGNEDMASILETFIVPIITVRYLLYVKSRERFFLLFMVLYSLSDLVRFAGHFIHFNRGSMFFQTRYYLGNILSISAYAMLLVMLLKSLSIKYVLRHCRIHLLVLSALNVYLIYVLQAIQEPGIIYNIDYYFECLYNVMMLLLLSVSLLNYFYRDNEKSLFLFCGVLCIVFAEVILVANIFISKSNLLSFLVTTLILGAFYFFYEQTKQSNLSREFRKKK
ncbi:hypothetical protein ACFFU1_15800 [Algibacter miyuki]|uniref:Uncharacterized protein n=1 Tax=Algibacter miyuki TaxID=1306933 RepID=A0ABV5H4X7_9FLAO|nr:hypothetical protein [Algibacter miyuki]MDN3665438.1 hypothetical protein [Algibacter miyuki]